MTDSPFYTFPTHTKFFLVRNSIEEFTEELGGVQVIGSTDQNELIVAFLEVLEDLMSFGFFATTEKIVTIMVHGERAEPASQLVYVNRREIFESLLTPSQ
tara:strand:+ start:118 stop:417 length:300 start_codon:yes stop_codon:yes gene_type:complete